MKTINKLFITTALLLTLGITALRADIPPPAYDVCGSLNTELVVPDLLGVLTAVGVINQNLCVSGIPLFLETNVVGVLAVTIAGEDVVNEIITELINDASPRWINVTPGVSVSSTGLVYNRITHVGSQTVTVKNTSGQTIAGPIQVVLVTSGSVTASHNTGAFGASPPYADGPYWTVSSSSLAPGASLQATISFSYTAGTNFSTTATVWSGALPPNF